VIENLVDTAIASLFSTIAGLKVVVGIQDNEPALTTPYCAVYSTVQGFVGRNPIYELLTTIEYVSISGQDEAADVETVMSEIDTILSTSSLPTVLWESISRTQQDVGDRRRNVRELKTFASIS
jgi:hypothetical protein